MIWYLGSQVKVDGKGITAFRCVTRGDFGKICFLSKIKLDFVSTLCPQLAITAIVY